MKAKMLDLNLFITPAASLTFQGIDGGETRLKRRLLFYNRKMEVLVSFQRFKNIGFFVICFCHF